MTTVTVHSGACGFTVTIRARKGSEGNVTLEFDTDCAMVKEMLQDIAVLDRFVTLKGFRDNPVYLSASKHLRHAACAVPSGILKAIEVETGLNVAKDADICFMKS